MAASLRALVHDHLMFAARSRQCPVVAACGGRPGKNEQPRNNAGFTPSAITSPGHLRIGSGPRTQIRQDDAAHAIPIEGLPARRRR